MFLKLLLIFLLLYITQNNTEFRVIYLTCEVKTQNTWVGFFKKQREEKTKLARVKRGSMAHNLLFSAFYFCPTLLTIKGKGSLADIKKKQEFKIIFKLIKGVLEIVPYILRKDYQQYFVLGKKRTLFLFWNVWLLNLFSYKC